MFQCIVLDWLNNPEMRVLLMTLNPAGDILPKNTFSEFPYSSLNSRERPSPTSSGNQANKVDDAVAIPSTSTLSNFPPPPPASSFTTLDGVPRGKSAYFLKKDFNVITMDNFEYEILCGDLPVHSKVETLVILFDEIYFPLLSNPMNRKMWPETVTKDLQRHMKDLRNTLCEVSERAF